MFRATVFCALCLAFVVVVVGAYVRLQHAGLGCPDWPGCYGQLVGIPDNATEIAHAARDFPGRPVEAEKAWTEMFHRYLAGTLGVLILVSALAAWRQRRVSRQSPLLPSAIVLLVVLQAALGMWTVSMLLRPVIVTLHLLGGMATLALLMWLALRQIELPPATLAAGRLRPWAAWGLVIVICQIALGGWVAANYAALACLDFPTCHGAWIPPMDFRHAFQLVRELGVTAEGSPLAIDALNAINWTHRLGALITFIYLGGLAIALMRSAVHFHYGTILALLVTLQVVLGIANVMLGLQLPIAVAHNAGAAALLAMLVVINFVLSRSHPRV